MKINNVKSMCIGVAALLALFTTPALPVTLDLGAAGPFTQTVICVPDHAPVIRGIILIGYGWGDPTAITFQPPMDGEDFALLGYNCGPNLDARDGSGQTMLNQIHKAAVQLNHPELDNVPMCFTGYSRGGDYGFTFAAWKPERVIAFTTNKSPFFFNELNGPNASVGPIPLTNGAYQVPAIVCFGDLDRDLQCVWNNDDAHLENNWHNGTPRIFRHARPAGARWALAHEWGTGHEVKFLDRLSNLFYLEMIKMRYPRGADPRKGPIQLLPLPPENTGWYGDNAACTTAVNYPVIAPAASFTGDKTRNSWLPNETIASAWRVFNSRDASPELTPSVKMINYYDFDMNFLGANFGGPFTILADTRACPGVTSVDFYDNTTFLGSLTTHADSLWRFTIPSIGLPTAHLPYAVANSPTGRHPSFLGQVHPVNVPATAAPTGLVAKALSGAQVLLSWNDIADANAFMVERSTGSGSGSFSQVAVTVSHTTVFIDSGLTASTQYTYRVKSRRVGAASVASANASVSTTGGAAAPALALIAPNGGETYYTNSALVVTWQSSSLPGNVAIDLSTDGGASFGTALSAGVPNTGSALLQLPAGVSGATCRVRIKAAGGSAADTSAANFAIAAGGTPLPPSLTLSWPNGGETVASGAAVTVSWTSLGAIDTVALELSTNGGAAYSTVLLAKTPNDGSQSVTLPAGVYGGSCRIRVKTLDGTVSDASNANFTIRVPVIAPTNVAYAVPALVLTRGVAMARDTVTWSGSPVDSFTISPLPLPAGLYFVKATGVIYGTPTATQNASTYIVTARNAGGTGRDTITIAINAPVGVGGLDRFQLGLLGLSGDPRTGTAGIRYTLPENPGLASIRFSLATLSGRQVWSRTVTDFHAGENVAGLDAGGGAGPMPAGLYFITMQARSRSGAVTGLFRRQIALFP